MEEEISFFSIFHTMGISQMENLKVLGHSKLIHYVLQVFSNKMKPAGKECLAREDKMYAEFGKTINSCGCFETR